MVKLNSSTQDLIEKEAIAFYKPFPLTKMTIKDLVKYVIQQVTPSDIAMMLIAMAAVTAIGMLTPKINMLLFGDVLNSGSMQALIGITVFMICVSISTLMFQAVQGLINSRIGTKLNLSVEAATMMRILSLPADFFKDYSAGELSNRSQYINGLCDQIFSMFLSTGLTSLFSLIYVAQIFIYAPALVAPALIITLLTLVVTTVQVLSQMDINKQRMLMASKESGMSYQLISGIQKIRLTGAERRAFARWGRASTGTRRSIWPVSPAGS